MRSYSRAAERHLVLLSEELIRPRPGECIACFVERMIADFGCDSTLRWSLSWRDACAPRATRLADRLDRRGGHCDCEVTMNAFVLQADMQLLAPHRTDLDGSSVSPGDLCLGVSPRNSTRPCALWLSGWSARSRRPG